MKVIKIFLKIIGIVFGLIFLILLIVPVFLKKPILEKAETEMNAMLNARVGIEDVSLSFIKNFPNLSVGLDGLSVTGVDEFEDVKLAGFKSFRVVVNLASLLSKKGPEVRAIILDTPELNGMVLENGMANWDIMKESEEEEVPEEEEEEEGDGGDLSLRLRKFAIIDAAISYTDKSSDLSASLADFDFNLGGKLGTSHTRLDIAADAKPVTVKMDGIPYLNKVILRLRMGIDADLENMVFTLIENEFALNDLVLQLEGNANIGGENPVVDMSFNTLNTSFKSLISLVPAIYMNDFQELETEGVLKLSGEIAGVYNEVDSTYPDVKLALEVNDAMFAYPDLPAGVEDINIDLKVEVDGSDLDLTKVDLNEFSLKVEDNPVRTKLIVRTPISDPHVKAEMKGVIDFSKLKDVMPVEGMEMGGLLSTDFHVDTRLSMVENEQYQDMDAGGNIALKDFSLSSDMLPADIKIPQGKVKIDPRGLEIPVLDVLLGSSDFHFRGKLNDYLLFAMKDEMLHGWFELSSNMIDVSELMPEGTEDEVEEVEAEDTSSLSVIHIPSNVDLSFVSELDHIKYDGLDIRDLKGVILIRDSKLMLEGLDMSLLDGSMHTTAEYSVADSIVPMVKMDLDIKDIDIKSSFDAFNTVRALAPFAKDMEGDVSVELKYAGELDNTMMPDISSIEGSGNLQSEEVAVVSAPVFDKMKALLKSDKAISNTMKDLNISFKIVEGRVQVDPFKLNMGGPAIISGSHGIDQSLDYKVNMEIPRDKLGAGANALIDQLGSKAAAVGVNYEPGDAIPVNFNIGGKIGDPDVTMGAGESSSKTVKQAAKEEVKKQVVEKVEETKQEVKEEVNKEVEKIMADAEREADNIRTKAREAAEDIRAEAERNAKKIENEAQGKGRIAENLAKKAADKVRSEGDVQANKLVKEADAKADAVLARAREKADALK